MSTQEPVRSETLTTQNNVHQSLGSLAEIKAMRTGLSSASMVAPGAQARADAKAFSHVVGEVFKNEKYDGFRARSQDIELTVDHLNSTKIGRPRELMSQSLLTVRAEMTAIMIAVEKTPDPRLAKVISAFADLERSGTAYALHEQKERTLAAINEQKPNGPGSLLRNALVPPAPAPGKRSKMTFGMGQG